MILSPRRIAECVQAFSELEIDRLWIKNMKETAIEERWPEIMEAAAGYERLILISDDGVVRSHALRAVQELLDEGHPVVTGYSNLDSNEHHSAGYWVNLNKGPLEFYPAIESFDLYTLGEVLCWPTREVPTTFCGFCLTGMSYELWQHFSYQTARGADFNLSRRLASAEIPIVAAREAFVWHVKEIWNRPDLAPRKKVRTGRPRIKLER